MLINASNQLQLSRVDKCVFKAFLKEYSVQRHSLELTLINPRLQIENAFLTSSKSRKFNQKKNK